MHLSVSRLTSHVSNIFETWDGQVHTAAPSLSYVLRLTKWETDPENCNSTWNSNSIFFFTFFVISLFHNKEIFCLKMSLNGPCNPCILKSSADSGNCHHFEVDLSDRYFNQLSNVYTNYAAQFLLTQTFKSADALNIFVQKNQDGDGSRNRSREGSLFRNLIRSWLSYIAR